MAGKPKKALWKRWWVWVGGFVVLIIIIASVGNGGASSTPTTAPAGNSTTGGAAKTPNTTKPVASKPTAPKSTTPVYRIGTPVTVGHLTVTVDKVTYQQQITNAIGSLSAKSGIWMIAEVTVKNNDTSAHTIDSSMFTLLQGKSKYQASNSATMYMNGVTFSYDQLNPGLSETGTLAFDVPAQGKYQMQVTGGMFSLSSATINLY
ncbi:DUF4352 domain-containing protein [Alicyclobacillus sp. ALC3]|uniref:DUF4352 domain-containing protein n=1 Tax=Alicyclobacillus sp. ALC3 TaxID=2796143 RepID=UPI0023782D69|nr:DUF4352 domain-containing protein [Alicyclobacillus sp. ALC3]WDL97843.1 DUF4352 domain-containing protein [Alicyclobacillus sp. ALC3]